jgi:hypothetical protein
MAQWWQPGPVGPDLGPVGPIWILAGWHVQFDAPCELDEVVRPEQEGSDGGGLRAAAWRRGLYGSNPCLVGLAEHGVSLLSRPVGTR